MANVINVLTVVDVTTTVNQGTGPAARVMLFDDNVSAGYSTDPFSGSELTVHCKVGDTINFYFTSLDPNVGIVGTKFVPTQGNVLAVGYTDYHWSGTVTAFGSETYHFTFMIDGQPGTYWFDPFINVPSPS